MKPLLIVNPKAGGGRTGAMAADIRAVVTRKLGEVDLETTTHRGSAIGIAERAARDGRELVIAVGGDGTFSEVAAGVVRSGAETRVGLIGQGTGGDFRKTLGLEHRLDRYVEAIASGHERRIDVGKARFREGGEDVERHFVNILSAGMGGLVDEYVAAGSRLLGGTAAYFVASTKALVRCKRARLRCAIDGTTERLESYMIAICNGRYFGSGMHVAPMALLDDGKFEVVSMDAPSKLAFAAFSRKIYDGSHLRSRDVRHFTCSRVEIDLENEEARETFRLDVDGEPLGGLPLAVEVVPGALVLRA